MRVVIVEDQVLLRDGLERLFADGGHEVVASQRRRGRLLAAVAGHRPDLVVLDVRMPPTFTDEGARAAEAVREAHPDVGVLVLSQHVETSHVVDLVRLGGFGYLLKDRVLDVEEFLAAARARGARRLRAGPGSRRPADRATAAPTAARRALRARARDPRVDGRMADQRGIAKRLFVSERTVEAHVRHLLSKLDIPQSEDGHRRVLAVLAQLSAVRDQR